MAYIIVHGTVDGYRKINPIVPIGTEQSALTDIRAEFDNTQSMLNKSPGYLIQMAESGVWISIVKLLFDGERSGGGEGFISFSAFLPINQIVSGAIVKQVLDDLLNTYLTKIGGDFTKNTGIDWSFVEKASNHLNSQCTSRTKPAKTNYQVPAIGTKKFAYVDITPDVNIAQYLDKPFQPEYGEYKAVFLGTHLQHPYRLAEQNKLVIDFDNELYDIIWQGDAKDFPNLPRVVRKKDIETGHYLFQKQCYICVDVLFKDGKLNTPNATLTLCIPRLEPILYQVFFNFNYPDKVESITATPIENSDQPPRKSTDRRSLLFYGEEALLQWHVTIKTTSDFQDEQCNICPFNDFSIEGGKSICLRKVQPIYIQIYIDGEESTGKSSDMIQIENIQLNRIESVTRDKLNKCIKLNILEDECFLDGYRINLTPSYAQKYRIESVSPPLDNEIYQVKLQSTNRSVPPVPPTPIGRELNILIPQRIGDNVRAYNNDNQSYPLTYTGTSGEGLVRYNIYNLHLDKYHSRDELKFFTTKGKQRLLAKKDKTDSSKIRIIGKDNAANKVYAWLEDSYKQILIGVGGLLVLLIVLCGVVFLLYQLKVPTVVSWINKISINEPTEQGKDAKTGEDAKEGKRTDPNYTLNVPYSAIYIELDSVYSIQKDKWNYDECYQYCSKYDGMQIELKKNDSMAYLRLKQLSWLWRTRKKLNERNWNHLAQFIKEGDDNFNEKWKNYVDERILSFLRDVVNSKNTQKRNNFGNVFKQNDAFKNKTFSEVLSIWEGCPNTASQSTSSSSSQNSGNNNSSKLKTGNNMQQSSGMRSAENF